MARTLLPGQTCRILLVDPASGRSEVVFENATTLVEAPNWSPDGRWLVVNGDGGLWRLPVEGVSAGSRVLTPVEMRGVAEINNDHVIAPDGSVVFVSARDGHLYEVPFDGGEGRRVTQDHPEGRGYKNYLHGVSPDGSTLSVIVGARPDAVAGPESWQTNVALVSVADGTTTFLTDDEHADDGAEFSPGGEWIWFTTERFTTAPGHSQLARMRVDGSELSQVTATDTVDWFPHPSPDDTMLLSLAFEAGTEGHPENRDVVLRILKLTDGAPTRRRRASCSCSSAARARST
ncbi:biopolymer transporter Tol [Frondihabitans sp. PAMC 28766]|uniref:TolB family protein n=1 Tax=Frondihabitans sp. PAMC 28766 TaxID=1795630 RepID=UPI000A90471B|nr:biopolymer transporter Tol [Frondihabitans sp. PAMC 28766]